jgi:hypothetical protein
MIKITAHELKDPKIDEVLNLEASFSRNVDALAEDVKTPFYYNPTFYYTFSAVVCMILTWLVIEHWTGKNMDEDDSRIAFISDYLYFGPVAAILGLALGAIYGLSNRNYKQMLYCGIVGIGVGLAVTVVTTFLGEIVFGIIQNICIAMTKTPPAPNEFPFKGAAFFFFMCGRGIAWGLVSMGVGLSLGVALKSKKIVMNGLVGGMIGGMCGGLLFDPVNRFLYTGDTAGVSRLVGIVAVGLFVGFFIGLFENISKDSWLLMLKGPLSGKQFNIFKYTMVLGSAPKCDIYLFKDAAIEPRHAVLTKTGNKYLLQDEGGDSGTFVNGRRIDKHILQPGDVVTIGETVLRYHEREK